MERTQRQILDTIIGVTVWKELTEVDFFSDYIWDGLAMMITNLEKLIRWLTTYPAGLKLNAHLNTILSQFFVYHIYLWQTYLSVASVYIGFGFISLSCFFGLSVFFAALSDLLQLLTVHIYCFHIYAFKLATLSIIKTRRETAIHSYFIFHHITFSSSYDTCLFLHIFIAALRSVRYTNAPLGAVDCSG
ncbi:N-acetylglucosaminyl transferase component (Gpi1) family protein [Brugia pahangi]